MAGDPFDLVGKVLENRYRVDAFVREGGFAAVYRGTQLAFDEPIAIKVLGPIAATEEAQQKVFASFLNEGKILHDLCREHSAFVRVIDMGMVRIEGGSRKPYIVMEWLDGESLEADLARRRKAGGKGRPLGEVLAVLGPIAEALTVAHAQEQRIAHRDIKPENIFLTRTPKGVKAKLLDFGIAKVMTQTGKVAFQEETRIGLPGAGTLAYAAPEQLYQARYGASGPWTDVYALALVCVEMLTDRPALAGSDEHALRAATTDEKLRPTPRARGASVSHSVEAIFQKALALDPKKRYPHAKAFWDALIKQAAREGVFPRGSAGKTTRLPEARSGPNKELPDTEKYPSEDHQPRKQGRILMGLLGAGGLLAAAMGGYLVGKSSSAPPAQALPCIPESFAVAATPASSVIGTASALPPTAPGDTASPKLPDPVPAPASSAASETPEPPGYLTIRCDPFCDDVVDNGKSLGRSPIERRAVEPGMHQITLIKGTKTKMLDVVVASGRLTMKGVSMRDAGRSVTHSTRPSPGRQPNPYKNDPY